MARKSYRLPLVYTQEAFMEAQRRCPDRAVELERTRNALKLDRLTSAQLQGVEYLVDCIEPKAQAAK